MPQRQRCPFIAVRICASVGFLTFAWAATDLCAQDRPARDGRRGGGQIVLNADDVPAFSEPPAGFDTKRDGIDRGKLEMVRYESTSAGTTRALSTSSIASSRSGRPGQGSTWPSGPIASTGPRMRKCVMTAP